jgi:hypothetical protein
MIASDDRSIIVSSLGWVDHDALWVLNAPHDRPETVVCDSGSIRDMLFGKRRRGSDWPLTAERFVSQLKRDGIWQGWGPAYETFKKQHGDRYTSLQSFQNAVYSLRRGKARPSRADTVS